MKKLLLSLASLLLFAIPMNAVTITAIVPSQAKVCYIAGNFNGWSTTATPMTSVNDTTFTADIDVSSITNDTLNFRLCAGSAWSYEQSDPTDNFIIKISTNPAINVKVKAFKAYPTPKEDLTIQVLVPTEVVDCYIVGSFNNWASPSVETKMTFVETTVDGDVFQITINAEAATLEFKFCAGPAWDYEQTDATNFKYAIDGKYVAVNSFKKIFDPSKVGTIVITASVPEGTERCWLVGSCEGWSMDAAIEGVKNLDGTFTFTVNGTQGFEYRLYNQLDWNHPEVDNTGADRPNRIVAYPADANTTIAVYAWKQAVALQSLNAGLYKAYCSNRTINVEGISGLVRLYDLTGRLIQSVKAKGCFVSDKLNSGIYMLSIDGVVRKMAVN